MVHSHHNWHSRNSRFSERLVEETSLCKSKANSRIFRIFELKLVWMYEYQMEFQHFYYFHSKKAFQNNFIAIYHPILLLKI